MARKTRLFDSYWTIFKHIVLEHKNYLQDPNKLQYNVNLYSEGKKSNKIFYKYTKIEKIENSKKLTKFFDRSTVFIKQGISFKNLYELF